MADGTSRYRMEYSVSGKLLVQALKKMRKTKKCVTESRGKKTTERVAAFYRRGHLRKRRCCRCHFRKANCYWRSPVSGFAFSFVFTDGAQLQAVIETSSGSRRLYGFQLIDSFVY